MNRALFTVERARFVWGLGIGLVMVIAVSPYPVLGVFSNDEVPHRIHNTVGAIQYLPLWAVPVLMFTFGRDRAGAWRVALASSIAMASVGLWSGDLIESASWMPLVTLLVVWPRDVAWRPRTPSIASAVAVVMVGWVTVINAPDLVDLQSLQMGDSHSLRFHFSGMAAAYIALTLSALVVATFGVGVTMRRVVAGSAVVAGACSLAWPDYESALGARHAWMLVVAGGLIAIGRRERTHGDVDNENRDELIGVYNADGTVLGEISYWVGARMGRTHCSLCEITHGLFAEKDEWRACERSLAIPFRTYHRDDAPSDVLDVAQGRFPIVLRRSAEGLAVVMSPEDLERFDGSAVAFTSALSVVVSEDG